jgi:hypothetical protein
VYWISTNPAGASILFGFDQPGFNGSSYRANGTMSAHGQTATGFDKQYSKIILRIMWRIQDTATHHIMTSRLKHQPLPYPIIFPQEMLPFFTHGIA